MSAVWGVSMVKDEVDVIAGTLNHLADEGVDHLLVADNGSTDGTRDLLADLAHELPLVVVDDPEPGYWQSEKMTALANRAHDAGAEWVIPFDADELWFFRGDRLALELDKLCVTAVSGELYNHFPSAVDPAGDDPYRTVVWRQPHPAPLPKVAVRWRPGMVIQQGNHAISVPAEMVTVVVGGIEIRHFPYRSANQFVRKARNGAAAYRATDLPADIGAHWRGYGDLLDRHGETVLHDVFRTYFWHLSPADAGLVLDPAPYLRWAAAEVAETAAAP